MVQNPRVAQFYPVQAHSSFPAVVAVVQRGGSGVEVRMFVICAQSHWRCVLLFPVHCFGGYRGGTSPIIIAELVHRKLNVCAGGIAQMKKRVPHIRTQESSASGTASMHAAESVIVPVKVISLAAGTTEKQISDLYHSGRRAQRRTPHMLHSTNGAVQVSAWIRPPVTSTRAITPSAASSVLPIAAPLCFSLQCSYGDASELCGPGICLFRGRKASSLSWTLRLQIPCLTLVLAGRASLVLLQ